MVFARQGPPHKNRPCRGRSIISNERESAMKREKEKLSKGAASGMVALVFLVLGFQLAIFMVKVVERPPRAEDARSEPGMTEKSAAGMTER